MPKRPRRARYNRSRTNIVLQSLAEIILQLYHIQIELIATL